MTTLFRLLFFSFILFWCGLVFASSGRVVEVQELRYADAQTVVPVIESLLGNGETVQNLDQRLIIHAAPEMQKKIRILLDQIDVPKVNLMIEVKQVNHRIKNSVHVGTSSARSAHAGTHLGNTSTSVIQRIVVQDGAGAFIVAGEEIPYASELAMVDGRNKGFYRKTDYKKIRTGFQVRPVLRGRTVDVEIVPFREKLRNPQSSSVDNPPVIDYKQALTRLRIPLNSWFDVGGTVNNSEQDDLATVRWSTGRDNQGSSVQMRIQLIPSETTDK